MGADQQSGDRPPPTQEEVREAILGFQRVYCAWKSERDPSRREELRRDLGIFHERLWLAIEPLLREVAIRNSSVWRPHEGSMVDFEGAPSVLDSVVCKIYEECLNWVITVRIDPGKNIVAFVMKTARYRLKDLYKASVFLPMLEDFNVADPNVDDMAQLVTDEVHRRTLWQVVQQYWATLPEKDQQIMRLRYSDPRPKWEDIGRQVNESSEYVRKVHERVLGKTIAYLRELGLLGPDEGRK